MTVHLYHYYETGLGPFRNLSSLSIEEAEAVSEGIRRKGTTLASKRSPEYVAIRRQLEEQARAIFLAKGGRPRNAYPHYMTLEACDWLETWYDSPAKLALPWDAFQEDSISFTYGDLFPAMRFQDDKPYRKQVYTKQEIRSVIETFGLPQAWNAQGALGPERYIEVQVWDEDAIGPYRR